MTIHIKDFGDWCSLQAERCTKKVLFFFLFFDEFTMFSQLSLFPLHSNISASSHQRRTMHQREERTRLVQKKQTLRAAAMKMKALWSLMRRMTGEGVNEKRWSPERWGFTHMVSLT